MDNIQNLITFLHFLQTFFLLVYISLIHSCFLPNELWFKTFHPVAHWNWTDRKFDCIFYFWFLRDSSRCRHSVDETAFILLEYFCSKIFSLWPPAIFLVSWLFQKSHLEPVRKTDQCHDIQSLDVGSYSFQGQQIKQIIEI